MGDSWGKKHISSHVQAFMSALLDGLTKDALATQSLNPDPTVVLGRLA